MDAVAAMLDGHRARGAFLLRCVMSPPWSVLINDRAQVAVLAQLRGETVLVYDGSPTSLSSGDVALVKGTHPYVLADDAATAPTVAVDPGQVCRTIDPAAVPIDFGPGLRTWGNSLDGPCALLTGTYELPGQVTGRLLGNVPD